MTPERRVLVRLQELIREGNAVLDLSRRNENLWQAEAKWVTSSNNLLRQCFGQDSEYYKAFNRQFIIENEVHTMRLGALEAALYDFENGFIFDMKGLLTADVFSDLLSQAEHLLKHGFYIPAAVVSGCVLEDGLRILCVRHSIPISSEPKMNYMNDQLKDKAYNALIHKNIAVWAGLRNEAAHGKWNNVATDEAKEWRRQVSSMIAGINAFLSTCMV